MVDNNTIMKAIHITIITTFIALSFTYYKPVYVTTGGKTVVLSGAEQKYLYGIKNDTISQALQLGSVRNNETADMIVKLVSAHK